MFEWNRADDGQATNIALSGMRLSYVPAPAARVEQSVCDAHGGSWTDSAAGGLGGCTATFAAALSMCTRHIQTPYGLTDAPFQHVCTRAELMQQNGSHPVQQNFTVALPSPGLVWTSESYTDEIYTEPSPPPPPLPPPLEDIVGLSNLGSDGSGQVTVDIGAAAFNEAFHRSSGIIYRYCPSCPSSHQHVYYKRLNNLESFEPYTYMSCYWAQNPDNTLGTDFDLYSSLADVNDDNNAWTFCNYMEGFLMDALGSFRDCGPSGNVGNTWSVMVGAQGREGTCHSGYGVGQRASFTILGVSVPLSFGPEGGGGGGGGGATNATDVPEAVRVCNGTRAVSAAVVEQAHCADHLAGLQPFYGVDGKITFRMELTDTATGATSTQLWRQSINPFVSPQEEPELSECDRCSSRNGNGETDTEGVSAQTSVSSTLLETGTCGQDVADLSALTSPHDSTTQGETNSYQTSCGGNGNEAIFGIVVQPGASIDIGQSTNSYDSRHETRWGGACPGTTLVQCTDDPDTRQHSWTNDQTEAQQVYFVVDAYSSSSGTFTLTWETTGHPPPPCPPGEYDHDGNITTPCLVCGAGSETDTLAQPGATNCTPCAAGSYDHDRNATTSCRYEMPDCDHANAGYEPLAVDDASWRGLQHSSEPGMVVDIAL
eukprot:SAG22_NODE_58_length_23645_cov_16.637943_1_plen_654_part_10